jgi:hypothetical protein
MYANPFRFYTIFYSRRPIPLVKPAKTGHDAVANTPARGLVVCEKQGAAVNLFIWLPLGFVLGLSSLALCFAFIEACDRI